MDEVLLGAPPSAFSGSSQLVLKMHTGPPQWAGRDAALQPA